VVVQTNARRLAVAGYAHQLVAAGVDALDVSMAGSTEAMHDYHTTVEGSFRQTVAGLRRARASGLTFGITVVITRSNYRHLAEIVHVAHTLGARGVHLAWAVPVGAALRNAASVVPSKELAEPHLEAAVRRARQLGLTVATGSDSGAQSAPQWFAGMGRAEEV
jgi:MoaA/NifB/PqqE/SkfB family radical SAM enzyme